MAGTQDANIAVRVGADLTPLQRDMKKASTSIGRFSKNAEAVSGVMKGMALAAAAAAAAVGVIAKASADAAREIKSLAMVSNVSVENFQRLAFAAKTVNVEQQKLADIFKDSQDKVGDFLSTGGGPLADYFENIAPLVGQTAKEFQYLSGPQILGKMQQGLDDANVSMAEQVFYLEAIASDASLLQPLLKNNAKGFNDLSRAAEDLNIVLSESEIEKLDDMALGFDKLAAQIGGETSKAILIFDDEIKTALEGASKGISLLARGFNLFFEGLRSAENKKTFDGINESLHEIFQASNEINGMLAEGLLKDTPKVQKRLQELQDEYDILIAKKMDLEKSGDSEYPLPDEFKLDRIDPADRSGESPTGQDTQTAEELKKEQDLIALKHQYRVDAWLEEWEMKQEQMKTLEDAEDAHYNKRMGFLRDFLSGQQGEYQHSAGAIVELTRKGIGLQQSAVVAGLASVLSSTSQHSKKAFEIQKKVALANAAIQGVQSAINAWRSGMETAGPWAPAVAAAYTAASLAKTGAMIQSIQSQTYSGGGGGGTGGGGGGGVPSVSQPQQQQAPQQNNIVSINLEGEVFGREQIRNLIGQMNDAFDDGYTFNVR